MKSTFCNILQVTTSFCSSCRHVELDVKFGQLNLILVVCRRVRLCEFYGESCIPNPKQCQLRKHFNFKFYELCKLLRPDIFYVA